MQWFNGRVLPMNDLPAEKSIAFSFVKGVGAGAMFGAVWGAAAQTVWNFVRTRGFDSESVAVSMGLCALLNGLIQGGIEIGHAHAHNRIIHQAKQFETFTDQVTEPAPSCGCKGR